MIMVSLLLPSERKKNYMYILIPRLLITPESLEVQMPQAGTTSLADFEVLSGSDILGFKSGEYGLLRKHSFIQEES